MQHKIVVLKNCNGDFTSITAVNQWLSMQLETYSHVYEHAIIKSIQLHTRVKYNQCKHNLSLPAARHGRRRPDCIKNIHKYN